MAAEEKKVDGADKPLVGEDFDKWLAEEIGEIVDKRLEEGARGAPPKPEPIKVKIGDNEYQFNDQKELNVAIGNLVSNYNKALDDAGSGKGTGEPAGGNKGPGPEKPKFDKEAWAKEFMEDPAAAIESALASRFGFDKPVEVIKTGLAVIDQQRRYIEATQFERANPDFPMDNPKAAEVIGAIMTSTGLPPTSQGLTAAWALAKQNGVIQPRQRQEERHEGPGREGTNRNAPPPYAGRRSDVDIPQQLQNLSLTDLETLLKRAGQL